jgi:carboxyl-terminal processing protease
LVLKYDTTGEAVKNLQNIMEGVGFPADRNDGYFSQATKTALEAFQKQESLPVTGDVNVATAQRLEEKLYVNLSDPEYDRQWKAALIKAREMMKTIP